MKHRLPLLAIILLAGCGGGGGNDEVVPREFVQEDVVSTVRSVRLIHPMVTATRAALGAAPATGTINYGGGLYYSVAISGTGSTVSFFKDAARTQSAGSMTLTRSSGGFGFPQTFDGSIEINNVSRPLSGDFTVTLTDTTHSRFQGDLVASGLSVDVDLSVAGNAIAGDIQANDGDRRIDIDNLNGTLDPQTGTLAAAGDLRVTPPGISASLDLVLQENGAGSLGISDNVSAEWNAAGEGTVTLAGGHQAEVTF